MCVYTSMNSIPVGSAVGSVKCHTVPGLKESLQQLAKEPLILGKFGASALAKLPKTDHDLCKRTKYLLP